MADEKLTRDEHRRVAQLIRQGFATKDAVAQVLRER